jgi:hypothetical protein
MKHDKFIQDFKEFVDYNPDPLDKYSLLHSLILDLNDRIDNLFGPYKDYSKYSKKQLLKEGGHGLYSEVIDNRKWLRKAKKIKQKAAGILRDKVRNSYNYLYSDDESKKIYDLILVADDDIFMQWYGKI